MTALGTKRASAPDHPADGRFAPSVFLRPIGTPMPLGMLGLTVATVMLGALQIGVVPVKDQHQVALSVLLFAVPLQSTAAVFGLLARDAVVGSGFGTQAAGWLTVGILMLLSPTGSRSPVLAVFLIVAAAALTSAVTVAAQSEIVPALVMAATVGRWVLTAVYELLGSRAVEQASAIEGFVLGLLALYTAVAADLESTHHRSVLPLGRVGAGRRALSGDVATDVESVGREAGVRPQL